MHPVKKITTAFSLLFLLAIPVLFSITMLLKQKVMHYQRDKRMAHEVLQTIDVITKNIIWIKPDKEVLIAGKMFDVKSFKTIGNSTSITGHFDEKEDVLIEQIVKLTGHKNQSGSPFKQPVIKFLFFSVFVYPQKIASNAVCWTAISTPYHSFDEMIPTAPARQLLHPPCC